MKLWPTVQILWPLLFLLAGCSGNREMKASPSALPAKVDQPQSAVENPKGDLFVLLPELDGKAGSIHVVNSGGAQRLDKPGDMTWVENFKRRPSAPRPLNEKEVDRIFGDALLAQPDLTPRFVSFILWFKSNETKLTDASKETLPEILSAIKIRKPTEIHIVGHTDRVGTDTHNLKLSSRRANLVRDFLIFKGITSSVLFVSFQGESRPLVYTEDEVAEPLNRRVELMIR